MSEQHPDKDWLAKFNSESSDLLDCQHADQYLAEITVLSDPHAKVRCANCGQVFEVRGTRWFKIVEDA